MTDSDSLKTNWKHHFVLKLHLSDSGSYLGKLGLAKGNDDKIFVSTEFPTADSAIDFVIDVIAKYKMEVSKAVLVEYWHSEILRATEREIEIAVSQLYKNRGC